MTDVSLNISEKTMDAETWTPVAKVSELFIYPLKCTRGLSVDKAFCSRLGLEKDGQRDRTFMVVDDSGKLIQARRDPKMVLIVSKIEDSKLIVNAPEMSTLTVPFPDENLSVKKTCSIFDELVSGLDCGDVAADWLTKYLERSARLVHFPWTDTSDRTTQKYDFFPLRKDTDICAFPDDAPVMMMSESSVADLNDKLPDKVTMRNFRPNIVITGSQAYQEDEWTHIKIGDAEFRNVKPCERCTFITLDPYTAQFNRKPLETLRLYRCYDEPAKKKKFGTSPRFGRFLALDCTGDIAVGDIVYKKVSEKYANLIN